MIYRNLTELIGKTPLIELSWFETEFNANAKICGKLEFVNPAGSVKDRVANQMIKDAEESGLLKKGGTIIEPTSGSTGIGLAAIGAKKGYNVIITMPETMSEERKKLMKAYGAKLYCTPGSKGMAGAVEMAEQLHKEIPDSIIAGQFYNPSNPKAHYLTTGPEIWEDTDGKVDIFVAGVGTGGTISGVGKYLKEKNPDIKVVAVEPEDSPLLSKGTAGPHAIQGIGANFIPENLNREIYDEIIPVSNDNAKKFGSLMAKKEGLMVGISSGAAVWAATQLASRLENKGKTIVCILPDTGERYISSDMFEY